MAYKNSDRDKAARKAYKCKTKDKFIEWKSTLSCVMCGENHISTLDFHHHTPNPANLKIAHLVKHDRFTFARKEIEEKCIVLCSNCHRKLHHEERQIQSGQLTER